jgi:hypothetical protein
LGGELMLKTAAASTTLIRHFQGRAALVTFSPQL